MTGSLRRALPFLTALALAGVVYFPITRNYFHQDDFINMQPIVNDPLLRYLLRPMGGHVLVVRNLLFHLFFQAFGTDPAWYFRVVLVTHLLNVGLLFLVIRRVTGSPGLACFGAALWGIAPVQEGALGWYSVYGHVIVGTLLLVFLVRVTGKLQDPVPLGIAELLGWCALLLVAGASFGVGVGIALIFPVVVLLLFPGERTSLAVRLLALAFPLVAIAEYRGAFRLYGALYGGFAEAAMPIMLMAMARVYWWSSVVMLLHLLAVGTTAVVGNVAVPVSSYPSPTCSVLVGVFLAALVAVLVTAPPATRRLLLALIVLALGAYAIVAAGRATLYTGKLVRRSYGAATPRYHYAATIPLSVVLSLVLGRLGATIALPRAARTALLLGGFAVMGVAFQRSGWKIDHHAADRQNTDEVVRQIGFTIQRATPGTPVYIQNRPFQPAVFEYLFAGWAAVFTIYFPPDVGRPVYFVEPDEKVRRMAQPGSRLAAVLVATPRDGGDGAP